MYGELPFASQPPFAFLSWFFSFSAVYVIVWLLWQIVKQLFFITVAWAAYFNNKNN